MRHVNRWRPGDALYFLILKKTLRPQVLIVLIGLGIPVLAVLPLELQRRIIDEAIPAGDIGLLTALSLTFAGVAIGRNVLKFGLVMVRGIVAEVVSRFLRIALIDTQRTQQGREARSRLGTVTSVLAAEVDPLGEFAAEAINTPLIQAATLIGVVGFMFVSEASLALVATAALVSEAILTPILQHRINRLTERRILLLRHAGAEMIAAANLERKHHVIDALHDIRLTYVVRLKMNVLKALLKILRNMIDRSADIAVLSAGALLVMEGRIDVGVIVAFMSGLREMRAPWGELVSFYRRISNARTKYHLVEQALQGGAVTTLAPPPMQNGALDHDQRLDA